MAEITMDRAVAFLTSDKQRDRSDGLAGWLFPHRLLDDSLIFLDLKRILQQNKQSPKLYVEPQPYLSIWTSPN